MNKNFQFSTMLPFTTSSISSIEKEMDDNSSLSFMNGTDNKTLNIFNGDDKEYIFDRLIVQIIFVVIYSIVFFSCFFGNVAVILVVGLHKKMRSVTSFYLANLSFANLCVGVFCIYQNLSTYFITSWVFGNILCKMYHFVHSLSYTSSILILVMICCERYLAILHPIKCRQILTINRLRISIIGVWTVSAIYSCPKIYYINTLPMLRMDGEKEILCIAKITLYDAQTFDMINFLLLFLIPLIIITVLYTFIGITLWQSSSTQITLTKETTKKSTMTSSSTITHKKTRNLLNPCSICRSCISSSKKGKLDNDHDEGLPSSSCKILSCCFRHNCIHAIQNQKEKVVVETSKENSTCSNSTQEQLNKDHGEGFLMTRENKDLTTILIVEQHAPSTSQIKNVQPIPSISNNIHLRDSEGESTRNLERADVIVTVQPSPHVCHSSRLEGRQDSGKKLRVRNISCEENVGLNLSDNGNFKNKMKTHSNEIEGEEEEPSLRLKRVGAIRASNRSGSEALKSRRRVVHTLMVHVLIFALCNLPYHARKIWQIWSPHYVGSSLFSALFTPATFICQYANCALNPILFAFMSTNFRASFRDVLSCRLRHRHHYRPRIIETRSTTLTSVQNDGNTFTNI